MSARQPAVPRNKAKKQKGLPTQARKLIVQNAQKHKNVLASVPVEKLVHDTGDFVCSVEHVSASDAEQATRDWAVELTRNNVKDMYIESGWGWNDDEKSAELNSNKAQYLLVRNDKKELIAFSHFRFDMDYGSHVLYCYEMQVEAAYQCKGIGAWIMGLLHDLAAVFRMEKVTLTVIRINPRAMKFYIDLGYHVDSSSPATLGDVNSGAYLILSRDCKSPSASHGKKPLAPRN